MYGNVDQSLSCDLKRTAPRRLVAVIALVMATLGATVVAAEAQNVVRPQEVTIAVSCLAGNGRVDVNIINVGDTAAAYRIEFTGLSARQLTVPAGDWWRMPITGRPDGTFPMQILRDGVPVSNTAVTIGCDVEEPLLTLPEVQVINACRGANGYILFQFINDSSADKPYLIRFGAIPNRSTTAVANGQSVRAVTGRPDGAYSYQIVSGAAVVETGAVVVDCDPDEPGYSSATLRRGAS